MANMVAMLVARNQHSENCLNEGLNSNKLIAYTSAASHYSIKKNMGILGLGQKNLRLIETYDDGTMNVNALMKAIEQDIQAGHKPFFINATSGTTVLGVYDDIEALSECAEKFGIWLHVDGGLWGIGFGIQKT